MDDNIKRPRTEKTLKQKVALLSLNLIVLSLWKNQSERKLKQDSRLYLVRKWLKLCIAV